MAQILVRKLNEDVVTRLKAKARAKGKSLEQEARDILTAAATNSREEFARWAAALRAKQPMHATSAAELIREDRNR
jgi:plasmid stability protein